MEQYDAERHCPGSGGISGTMTCPNMNPDLCYSCNRYVPTYKGRFIIHPSTNIESTFTEEVIPVSTYDPGFCSGCGKEDNARFTVRGINPREQEREFFVCAGVLKGGTVRSK